MMVPKIEILYSGIWQLSSIIISDAGECLLVDPGYFPRELEDIKTRALSLGTPKSVIFTHGHWDHVVGWSSFPESVVYGSVGLRNAVLNGTTESKNNLRSITEFDQRWYVERPLNISWPTIHGLKEGDEIFVGNVRLRILETPGHSSDGLALHLEDEGILIVGDYLSPLEIPFVENLEAYQKTLKRFIKYLPDIKIVIPGHGPQLTPAEASKIAEADLEYLEMLEKEVLTQNWEVAMNIPLPRAENTLGMKDYHIENCIKAGIPNKDQKLKQISKEIT